MAEFATPDKKIAITEDKNKSSVIAQNIRSLLGGGQLKTAQAVLEKALLAHPGNAELLRIRDVIAPGCITSVPGNSPNIKAELDWIAHHREQYHGKWVALIGKQVIAIEDDTKELLSKLKDKNISESPFVYHLI